METNWKNWIEKLDFKSTKTRRGMVIELLEKMAIKYEEHNYKTGTNLIVKFGEAQKYFAVSCHIDRDLASGGANDNASAIAVCLGLAKYFSSKLISPNLLLLFFDEEESQLKGSRAYVNKFGYNHIHSLVNLELVGNGENFVLWKTNEPRNAITKRIEYLVDDFLFEKSNVEDISKEFYLKHLALLMPVFAMYYSDAEAFIEAGFENAITITRIGEKDYINARSLMVGDYDSDIEKLLTNSELLKYYHNKKDNGSIINDLHIKGTINFLIELIEKYDWYRNNLK